MKSKNIVLHVLAPGLLSRLPEWGAFGPIPRYPWIERLLANGQRRDAETMGYERTLCDIAGLKSSPQEELPLGTLTRIGHTIVPDTNTPYFCADPIYLRTDIKQLYVRDKSMLNLQEDEANALVGAFNQHFMDRDLQLEINTVDSWHLKLTHPESVHTYPVRSVMGKDINKYLPGGERGRFWRGIMNETQMLFHTFKVNQEREARGEYPVNSLWFYGAGCLPNRPNVQIDRLWANDSLAAGLGQWLGLEAGSLPSNFKSCVMRPADGNQVISLEQLHGAASYDDFNAWQEAMQMLEQHWFMPIEQALNRSDIVGCYLYDCEASVFYITRKKWWQVWKKPLSLDHYAKGPKP